MSFDTLRQQGIGPAVDQLDKRITAWMARYGIVIMRVGLGVVFFWFGVLKLFPGLSPAEDLVRNTIYFVDPDLFLPVLAIWEALIGLGLITGKYMRATLLLLFMQMPGTALPLVVLPDVVWTVFPYGLTLEGQYIVKNLVLIGAGLVIGGTVRGGRLVAEPPT
ncbi:MAG: DoxX family membrane protein [Caldilineaceae bacterium]